MKRLFLHFLYKYLFIICLPVLTNAQQGNFKNFTVNDGLAQSQVYSISESADGYLWIGTRGGGISKFDGLEFETFTKKDGLPSNYITYIYKSKDEKIWIGTSNGICIFFENKFINITIDSLEKTPIINTIFEDKNGTIWIGTNQGLYSKKNSSFQKKELNIANSRIEITAIVENDKTGIWIGTNHGLVNFNIKDTLCYKVKDGLGSNYVRSLSFDRLNNLWIGTYGRGISILNSKGISRLETIKKLNSAVVHSIINDSEDNIWIATLEQGLIKWNTKDSTAHFFTEKDGLANNHVKCVYEDLWKNIWIGTSGGGFSKFSGQHFKHYNSASSNLKSNYIYALEAANDSDIWISTSGLGVNRFVNDQTYYYGSDSGFVNAKVKTIFQDNKQNIWLGTEGKGMFLFDGQNFNTYNFNQGIESKWIKDIKQDPRGNIWVATSGAGISKINPTWSDALPKFSYENIKKKDGLTSDRISFLHIDKTERVWVAYQNGGISCIINDTSIFNFNHQKELNSSVVRCLVEDSLGNLWIGTGGKGLYHTKLYTDSIAFVNLSTKNGLSSDNIYLLDIDKQSNLWIGSEKGADRVKYDEDGIILELSSFGADEGFKGIETCKNAITVDIKGGIWIGTINGLYKYNSNYKNLSSQAPVLTITDVSLFYKSIKESHYAAYLNNQDQPISLNYTQNHITFDFKGIFLTKPKKVRYKWKLSGLENEWSPTTSKMSITYSNLKPGNYIFQVMAQNEGEIWNKKPQTIAFTIVTPLWQKTWFLILLILCGIVFIALIIWSRIRIVSKKARAAQQLLLMEKEVLTLEQRALRLQMNPHFIFNCLNSIQSMIVKKDTKSARYFLSKFSKLIRKTLDNSKEQLILLDDEIETLENYLSIEKFCNEEHFDYSIEIAEDVVSDFIQIPPMLIQPFVENAIIHGVAHRKVGGKITVSFQLNKTSLSCIITDNGVGRVKANRLNMVKDHKSTALIVTEERLNLLGDDSSNQKMKIEDILDKNEKICGTRVTIIIPTEI